VTSGQTPFEDRPSLARWLIVVGSIGMAAAFIAGVTGWILAGRATTTVTRTIVPVVAVVEDVVASIEASEVLFERTTEAIESIENATRSSVRTLDSVATVLDETAVIAGGGIADSLDAAVDTLPGLISTSGVIDSTMRALRLVGVDYDPQMPLDESLERLEASLAPVPGQIRDQVALLEDVQADLDQIVEDGRGLAAVLLEARLDMVAAERLLRSARANAEAAAESVAAIEGEIDTYDTLARLVVVAAALALMAGASAPLTLGIHLRREAAPDRGSHPDT
jgi:hypothetical protein